jgi:hypothetical protein
MNTSAFMSAAATVIPLGTITLAPSIVIVIGKRSGDVRIPRSAPDDI